MLRTKLVVAFIGLLGPAVIMGCLLYWGPRQIETKLERTLLAHNEVQAYLELALEAQGHLQQLGYDAMLGRPVTPQELSISRQRLSDKIADLRRLTLDELAFVGHAEPEERDESGRGGTHHHQDSGATRHERARRHEGCKAGTRRPSTPAANLGSSLMRESAVRGRRGPQTLCVVPGAALTPLRSAGHVSPRTARAEGATRGDPRHPPLRAVGDARSPLGRRARGLRDA